MQKTFKWLGIQDAFKKGLIARIVVILCLLYIVFGAFFPYRSVRDDRTPSVSSGALDRCTDRIHDLFIRPADLMVHPQ